MDVGVPPADDVNQGQGQGGGGEAADGQDELSRQVPELWQEAVEQEGQDEAEEGDGQADGVDVLLDDGLHVNLDDNQIIFETS